MPATIIPTRYKIKTSYVNSSTSTISRLHILNTSGLCKINWKVTCSGEMEIFTFYESLKHMASTCGIPMRAITDIDEDNGVCPLSAKNCANYEVIYPLMAGAIYHKMNDSSLWKGYAQGWNLITSNLHDCDGFEVLYDVLGEILPKLNINTAKAEFIQKPIAHITASMTTSQRTRHSSSLKTSVLTVEYIVTTNRPSTSLVTWNRTPNNVLRKVSTTHERSSSTPSMVSPSRGTLLLQK